MERGNVMKHSQLFADFFLEMARYLTPKLVTKKNNNAKRVCLALIKIVFAYRKELCNVLN